jgi:hypothetical protein
MPTDSTFAPTFEPTVPVVYYPDYYGNQAVSYGAANGNINGTFFTNGGDLVIFFSASAFATTPGSVLSWSLLLDSRFKNH